MEYLLQSANSTSSSSHGGSQQQHGTDQQQKHRQRSSSINTGRGAAAARVSSTGGRGETEEKQDAAAWASTTRGHAGREGAPRQRVGARRGLAGDHGGRARAPVHQIVEAGSGNARRWITAGGIAVAHGTQLKVESQEHEEDSRELEDDERELLLHRIVVEIPATPAGNPRGMGSRRRRSGRRWRSKYLATAAALKVHGDGGGTLPGGRQIAQLGGADPTTRI
ncbi:uncharacterized protein [Triticum aestivum]|uniref:uncharacterized protein n=1 Tax=Triticum aestivum TaxID=4565 RepID=UPI001D00A4A5|nr:uncharacterized protein LOC123038260 [Triticum aestivum]